MSNLYEMQIENFLNQEITKYLVLAFVLIGITVYVLIQNKQLKDSMIFLEEYLKAYYQEKGFELLSVSKMTMTDRIKYKIPISPFISLLYSSPSFFTSYQPIKIFRVLETTNGKGTEFLHYVEILLLKGGSYSVNEFDSYEF